MALIKSLDEISRILRIAKFKQKESYLRHTENAKQTQSNIQSEINGIDSSKDDEPEEIDDVFLSGVVMPDRSSTTFVKRKFDKIHGISEDDTKTLEYQYRPALLTQMIKGTRNPYKLMTLWLRDRDKCDFDHINTSAAIVHLAQLSLDKLHPQQIYEKTMSWTLIRLIRDVMQFIDSYDMRHIANILWSIGVLTANQNGKIHRDFRRLTAKLISRFESDIELRRKCNVQNMVDMLWAMDCVGLKVHSFFYQFCIDLYCKLDVDVGVTPDALAYLATLYAARLKLNEKIRLKIKSNKHSDDDMNDVDVVDDMNSSESPKQQSDEELSTNQKHKGYLLYNEHIPKRFWLKLLKEFCDDFVLIEAEPHHVANVLWAFGRIGANYLSKEEVDPMEEQWIMQCFNKLLSFIQNRLDHCDGQTLSILLWCVSCSNYSTLTICKKHGIFDSEHEQSVGSRLLQLVEAEDCYLIPNDQRNDNTLYLQRYGTKVYSLSLRDCIVIFESVTKMEYAVPSYVLTLMMNRMKEQLKYSALSARELISLLESVDALGLLTEDSFCGLMARKLTKVIAERPKSQWNYSEFIGLLGVMNGSAVLHRNLDLVNGVLSALQLNKQGWGQLDGEPIEMLNELFVDLEQKLKANGLIMEIEDLSASNENGDGIEDEEDGDNDREHNNLSILIAVIRDKLNRKLEIRKDSCS